MSDGPDPASGQGPSVSARPATYWSDVALLLFGFTPVAPLFAVYFDAPLIVALMVPTVALLWPAMFGASNPASTPATAAPVAEPVAGCAYCGHAPCGCGADGPAWAPHESPSAAAGRAR